MLGLTTDCSKGGWEMSSDSSAASSMSSRETNRRRLLAFLGAGGLGALATLFTRQEARAGHDGTNVMHIGEVNTAAAGRSTELRADVDQDAIHVRNFNAGPNSGALGARCDDGIGVIASSERGIAGFFQTDTGQALGVNGPSGLVASTDNRPALAVQNLNDSDGATAIRAITRGGGTALTAESFGSPSEETGAVAILGVSKAEGEPEALGSRVGVEGVSGTGVGVAATCFDGIALVVNGKAAFGTGGTDVIPAGQNSTFVPFRSSRSTATSRSRWSATQGRVFSPGSSEARDPDSPSISRPHQRRNGPRHRLRSSWSKGWMP